MKEMRRAWAGSWVVAAALLAGSVSTCWAHDLSATANDDDESAAPRILSVLSAQWWQFVFSIPASVNPTNDSTGAYCMVGQRGDLWFLTGANDGKPATRKCSIPEGKAVFFPVINNFGLNTPDVCGQVGSMTVDELREMAREMTDGVTQAVATFDGRPLRVRRVVSKVFDATFPQDNLFSPCLPAGVYSPGVDDGYYAVVERLTAGTHVLHIQGAEPGVTQDVVYNLNVVPVQLK